MMKTVETIPVLNDNWVYLIHSEMSDDKLLIDAGEAAPVVEALEGASLSHILITHHHADHIHGVDELKKTYGCQVLGSAHDLYRLPSGTRALHNVFHWHEYTFQILQAPGHTKHHIMFYEPTQKWLFSGDTLFVGGCGRLFEGTPKQMFQTLARIKALPDETYVFCGHDLAESNLAFANHTWPEDKDIAEAYALEKEGELSHITTIEQEKRINPFMRAKDETELRNLRMLKDHF